MNIQWRLQGTLQLKKTFLHRKKERLLGGKVKGNKRKGKELEIEGKAKKKQKLGGKLKIVKEEKEDEKFNNLLTRNLPKIFIETMKELSKQRREWVRGMGCAIRLGDGSCIEVNEKEVDRVLGMPRGKEKISRGGTKAIGNKKENPSAPVTENNDGDVIQRGDPKETTTQLEKRATRRNTKVVSPPTFQLISSYEIDTTPAQQILNELEEEEEELEQMAWQEKEKGKQKVDEQNQSLGQRHKALAQNLRSPFKQRYIDSNKIECIGTAVHAAMTGYGNTEFLEVKKNIEFTLNQVNGQKLKDIDMVKTLAR
ncbi:hypothetical protein V2J09_006403 [Rumex salicifolius]